MRRRFIHTLLTNLLCCSLGHDVRNLLDFLGLQSLCKNFRNGLWHRLHAYCALLKRYGLGNLGHPTCGSDLGDFNDLADAGRPCGALRETLVQTGCWWVSLPISCRRTRSTARRRDNISHRLQAYSGSLGRTNASCRGCSPRTT